MQRELGDQGPFGDKGRRREEKKHGRRGE